MKVLVTGASGFVGVNLIKRLSEKNQVRALVRRSSDTKLLKKRNIEIVYGDLNDSSSLRKALQGIEVVYHLAGVLTNSHLPDKIFTEVNVVGTKNLLKEAVLINTLKHFIHCSSAYVCWKKDIYSDEATRCVPENIYELTKLKGEKIVKEMTNKAGFPITIVRPGLLYGQYNTGLIPLFKAIRDGKFFFIGKGDHLFEMTHIDDFTRLLEYMMNNQKSFNQTFIVSERYPKTFQEIIYIIADSLGVKYPNKHLPEAFFGFALKVYTRLKKFLPFSLPLSKESYKTLTANRSFNNNKVQKILGYQPSIKVETGINNLIKWYKRNKLVI